MKMRQTTSPVTKMNKKENPSMASRILSSRVMNWPNMKTTSIEKLSIDGPDSITLPAVR